VILVVGGEQCCVRPAIICTDRQAGGYSDKQICCALNQPCREIHLESIQNQVAFLPFLGPTFSHLSRVLLRHNIKTVVFLPREVGSFLQPVKDDLGLKTLGVYSIPFECGKVHIGQTRHSTETRNTISTSSFIIQRNQPWLNTA